MGALIKGREHGSTQVLVGNLRRQLALLMASVTQTREERLEKTLVTPAYCRLPACLVAWLPPPPVCRRLVSSVRASSL